MAVDRGHHGQRDCRGEPPEKFNEGDDVDEGVEEGSNYRSYGRESSSDDEDQKYIDDQKVLQNSVNPSNRNYFGSKRQVTKYIPSASDAKFMVKVSLSLTRIRRLKSEALVFDLRVDGKLLRTNI